VRIIKNCYFCRLWEFYFYRQGRVDMIGYIQVINFLLDRAKSNKLAVKLQLFSKLIKTGIVCC
jgi:hypothetical protein